MGYIGIDLGSTNTKAALFDDDLKKIAIVQKKVDYIAEGVKVEFDVEVTFKNIIAMLREFDAFDIRIDQIVLTGQAESLVCLDASMDVIAPAISWMDSRSEQEAAELSGQIDAAQFYDITGQTVISTTWPATKILHTYRNDRTLYEKIAKFVLLKDYIAYRLCGVLAADKSIATFSSYFNIHSGTYWDKMLALCRAPRSTLPDLVEPCTVLGKLSKAYRISRNYADCMVNTGTLDHFAGMIGTGNITEGMVSESTGTVLGISTLVRKPFSERTGIPLHYGPFHDTYVLLSVAESGGSVLQWFKDRFIKDRSLAEIDDLISRKQSDSPLLFLPHIIGVNGPENDSNTCGMFFGIRSEHDEIDFAKAVIEGITMLFARNVEAMRHANIKCNKIISTGGGAKSSLWSQMKADYTGLSVVIPEEKESACFGSAIIGAVSNRRFCSFTDAIKNVVVWKGEFTSKQTPVHTQKMEAFSRMYRIMVEQYSK